MLALSPGNFSIGFPARPTEDSDIKSGLLNSPSPPNPAPDTASTGLADGIYLYGQSSKPDEIKKEYFVFEMRQSKVVGAFYLPRSAFYCFYGTGDRTQLNLTVVDSYDGSRSPYSVNLQQYYPISRSQRQRSAHLGYLQGRSQTAGVGKVADRRSPSTQSILDFRF